MKKADFVALGISEELAARCETASAEELKGYIPKARFDEVNDLKKRLEADVKDRDGQLEELKKATGDADALKATIEKLQADNKAKDDAHAAEIKKLKVDAAIEATLTSAKAKNNTAVRALLKDLDKAELLEDGSVKGLADQIKALTAGKDTAFLFDSQGAKLKGAKSAEKGDQLEGGMTLDKLRKLSSVERFKFSQDHPEEYKHLYGGNE